MPITSRACSRFPSADADSTTADSSGFCHAAGSAFFEPADARILHFDNHSDTEPMVFVAFYLLNGEQKLIEMPDA